MLRRAVEVGDGVVVRHRLRPERLDLLAHLGRGVFFGPAPVEGNTDVVDDDRRAFTREAQRELASDAAPRTRDDRDATVEQSHLRDRRGGRALDRDDTVLVLHREVEVDEVLAALLALGR